MSTTVKIPYLSFTKIDRKSSTPIYMQLSNQFSNAIQRNLLPKGTKLPGTRKLSELLQVNRQTVIAAYDELEAQGWIEIRPNQGTFVVDKQVIKTTKVVKTISEYVKPYPARSGFTFRKSNILDNPYENVATPFFFTDGTPDVRLTHLTQLSATYSANLKRKVNKRKLVSNNYDGNAYFRKNMANFLNLSRGTQITSKNILITRSCEMSSFIASEVLLEKGDKVIVANLGHFSINMTFHNRGAQVLTVGVDDDGIIVDEVEALCRKHKIRLLYLTPHHHYPTTVTLSPQRRVQLLKLARAYGFVILEDDYDYDFHYDKSPILPLIGSDNNGMVVYTGVFGRSLAPGFRMGFIVAPEDLINEMKKYLGVIDPQGDVIMEQVLGELIEEGEINRYLKKAIKVYQDRRNNFCNLLDQFFDQAIKYKKPSGGLAVWVEWQDDINLMQMRKEALGNDLFLPKTILYQNKTLTAMRLGFGHLNKDEMENTVSILYQSIYK